MIQAHDKPLRCSIFLADAEQRYTVKTALKDCGRALTFCNSVAESEANANRFIDIFFTQQTIGPGAKNPQLPAHGYELALDYIPTISSADFDQWKAGIKARMDEIVQQHDPENTDCPAPSVWLLAASAGGLKAVTEFLGCIEPRPYVGFVYAQHIESNHVNQLVKMVRRHTSWQAEMARDNSFVKGGVVTIASPDHGVKFAESGRIRLDEADPKNRYRPSINGLCIELARRYQNACGMIAFSGMGGDGVDGSRAIKASGGKVWLQSPASCEVPALPEAILERGEFDHCDEIAVLAKKFGDLRDHGMLVENRQ